MYFFSLQNGKKIDLSGLQSGIRIDEDNEFLKKYDENNNSIFDEKELAKFKEDLQPYLKDGVLDMWETLSWFAKVFGFSSESLKADNAAKGRDNSDVKELVENSLIELMKSAAEADCVAYLKQNGVNATVDMLTRDNGVITELYDKIKEGLDDSLSPNYIYSLIFSEVLSNNLLEDAQNGTLTKNEYIERKITIAKAMLMHKMMNEYFEEEFANINIPREQLEGVISQYFDLYFYNLVEYAANNYDHEQGGSFDVIPWSINSLVERLLQDEELEKRFFKNVSCTIIQDISNFFANGNSANIEQNYDLSQIYIVPNISYSGGEFLTFEQVFKMERGREFDVEAYQEFMNANNEMQRIMGPYNKMSVMLEQTDKMLDAVRRLIASNSHSGLYDRAIDAMGQTNVVNAPTVEAIENICDLFTGYYGGDIELAANDLNEIIQSKCINGLKVTITPDGKSNIGFKKGVLETFPDKMYAITQLLEGFQEEIKYRFNLVLGGKSLDTYIENYNSTRIKALGQMCADQIVDMYKADNGTVIQRCTGVIKTTGMVMVVIGGVLCVTPAVGVGAAMTAMGGKMAIGGMVADYALQYTEALTRDEISEEELANVSKYFIMDAAGFIIGFKAGQMGNKVFSKILDKKLGEVLKQEITTGNRMQALKTVISNKSLLKNFMKAAGAKIGTDFLISYVGDLVMMGILDTEDDYLSLLKANLLGIVVGTSGDLANIGHLSAKHQRYIELREKQNTSLLKDTELRELNALEQEFRQAGIDPNRILAETEELKPEETPNRPGDTEAINPTSSHGVGYSGVLKGFEHQLSFLKDKNGVEIFTKEDIENIGKNFSDKEIYQLSVIMDCILGKYTQDGYTANDKGLLVANTLRHIMENVDPKNWGIIKEMYDFKSTYDIISDGEWTYNLLGGGGGLLGDRHLQIVKILMDISKEEGREYLRNIYDIIEYACVLKNTNYSINDIFDIFHMRDENGGYVINEQALMFGLADKVRTIEFEIKPEKLEEYRQKIKKDYPDITEAELNNIVSNLRYVKHANCLDELLNLRNTNGELILDIESLNLITKYISNEESIYGISLINNLISNIKNKCSYFENDDINLYCKNIMEFITDKNSEKLVWKLLHPEKDCPLDMIDWFLSSLNNVNNKTLAVDTAHDVMVRENWECILPKLNSEEAIELYNRMISKNNMAKQADAPDDFSPTDIVAILTMADKIANSFKSQGEGIRQKAYKLISKAIEEGCSSDLIRILDDVTSRVQDINILEGYVTIGTLKDASGNIRFDEAALKTILRAAGGYNKITIDQLQYLINLAKDNPNMTTKQIVDKIHGKEEFNTPNRYEYPFGSGGKFEEYFNNRILNTVWSKLSEADRKKLFDYLTKLINQDENRFIRLVESGYFELCAQGKLDIQDLIKNCETNRFFSKHFLDDVRKLYTGEPLVKEYPIGTPLVRIAETIDEGEVASVGGNIYVNDGGRMVELKMTKEAFEKLFPLESRFNTKQQSLGDCWLISAIDNLMDLPSGRAKIYQLFEQDGDNITIKISHTEYINEEVTDANGKTMWVERPFETDDYSLTWNLNTPFNYKHFNHAKGCLGLQLLEAVYAVAKAEGPQKELSQTEVLNILNDATQMQTIDGGQTYWFFNDILGYVQKDGLRGMDTYDANNYQNLVGQNIDIDSAKDINNLISTLEDFANDENTLCYFYTKFLPNADKKSRREVTLSSEYDLYSNHAYTIKGYDADRGLVYFTNPWDTNSIIEMDIYNFVSYISKVGYMRLN